MKRANCIVAVTLLTAAFSAIAAPESCERIKSDIAQRIINNGVPEANFTLTIVPNDQADSQVVGHCANDTHKILYVRTSSGNAPANATPYQDAPTSEPQ